MKQKKLWGGRFSKQTNEQLESFSRSIQFDYKLAEYDCWASLIHIKILKKAKLLSAKEYTQLEGGLKRILKKVQSGQLKINTTFEDIHSYIQYLLENDKRVGKAALKLHTCRSRNEQVVFDTKTYCAFNIFKTIQLIEELNNSLKASGNKNQTIYMPGYTHMQHAMPVKLSNYLDAFAKMFARDIKRLTQAFNNVEITLGAGALAGTFIESKEYELATKLVLKKKNLVIKPTRNSIDAVSDRDFVIEICSAISIIGMHLSRLSEDLILWSSREFNFITLDDTFCTGSSLMPQKKNPDALELIRGCTGKLYGNLTNILVVMKGLPLTYNRDMQHDKEPLFDSFETIQQSLAIMTGLIKTTKFNKSIIQNQCKDESLYATDLADHLVKEGVPFKTAHALIGKLFRMKENSHINIADLKDRDLSKIHPLLNQKVLREIINPIRSIKSKKSIKK